MAFLLNIFIITYLSFSSLIYVTGQQASTGQEQVSKVCLGCICEVASGCNVTIGCDESVCGPFRITWAYWVDAGKPTLNDNAKENAYAQCVNDPYCAARAVQGYMAKFAKDCDGDGNINCYDFLRIHRFGGYGCSGNLNSKYENTFKLCMQTFSKE
ncbi:lysozyme-like isoform X1 [Frieseomelitta varia]|uniref:lysozyme-like isoform X1 n=1 Tax=Frieseomelitta varia TaxID=561572 RepID=UPI001CB6B185|nr:lysozyme-like isoform X1 [Frieseomelitta varia]